MVNFSLKLANCRDSDLDIITKTTLYNKCKNCVFLISHFKRNFTIKQFACRLFSQLTCSLSSLCVSL